MVISVTSTTPEVVTPELAPANDQFAAIQPAPETTRPTPAAAPARRLCCQRCNTRMLMGYDESQCLNCGYADYSFTNLTTPQEKRSIVSTATRFVLRYVGDFPTLGNTLTYVKLIRVRNRVVYAVKCPFCEKSMDQSSLSGKRPEVREQRYKCLDGHRVSLVPGRNGMLGWR